MEKIRKVTHDGLSKEEYIEQLKEFTEAFNLGVISAAEAGLGVSILVHNSTGFNEVGEDVLLGTHYSIFVPNIIKKRKVEKYYLEISNIRKSPIDELDIDIILYDDLGMTVLFTESKICECTFMDIQNNMDYNTENGCFTAELKPDQIEGYENLPIKKGDNFGFGYDFKTMKFKVEGFLR